MGYGIIAAAGRLSPRVPARRAADALLNRLTIPIDGAALGRAAIVFAPHPDDETLGCGGTILKKRAAGATVTTVFMTDGRRSHRHLMTEDELAAIRSAEARAASRALGVQDSVLLGFPDTGLTAAQAEAVPRVAAILAERQPDEVYVPYYREPPADHVATRDIVLVALRDALRDSPRKVTVYEYPVWFWDSWPWTPMPRGRDRIRRYWRQSGTAGMGLLRGELRWAVSVGDVLAGKRAALDLHASQMRPLRPDVKWPALADVAEGEWLACFFQPWERFYRYEVGPGGGGES